MPKAYSEDLRARVIEAVELGASRHEAAERFEVSVSSSVRWLQAWRKDRRANDDVNALFDEFERVVSELFPAQSVAPGIGHDVPAFDDADF